MGTIELSIENQRIKNELMVEEYEREAFVEQLG